MRYFALLMLLAACSDTPTGTSGAAPSDAECASRANDTEAKLVECIRQDALWTHMQAFQQIADANPGPDGHASRNSGEPGYLASVNYVADLLRTAGYRVTVQAYTIPYASFTGTPSFSEVSPTARTFALLSDWSAQPSSANGEVTGQIQPVGGITIPPSTTSASSSGCSSGDFAGFVHGRIALIQIGTCPFVDKARLAAAAGAGGVVIFNSGRRGTRPPATAAAWRMSASPSSAPPHMPWGPACTRSLRRDRPSSIWQRRRSTTPNAPITT